MKTTPDTEQITQQLFNAMRECGLASHWMDQDDMASAQESAVTAYMLLREVLDKLEECAK